PFKKILILILSLTILFFAGFQVFRIYNAARRTLAETRARQIEQNRVAFEKRFLTPHTSPKIQIIQNTDDTRDFIKFKNLYFAATGGGLVQFDEGGRREKHFTALDGLPESDLTALAVFENKLFIGTRTKNLVAFDGENFENYIWTDRKAQAVTAFAESDGRLLIGTFGGGLLEFDGTNFTEIKADGQRISAVNCIYKSGAKLFVGTFDNGILIYENGVWARFTTAENLPSNRIVGILLKDKNLYVATDFGLAVRQENAFRTIANLPALASLILRNNQILLSKDNGEIYTFENSLKKVFAPQNLHNARLATINEKTWLVSNQGISEIDGKQMKPFNQTKNASLTDNFASALAFDDAENLWVGTFRRGIDVFSPDGKKLKHLESESVREINFLQANGEIVSAATSAGIVRFKKDFSAENTTQADGLPSNSITHFSGDFMATAKGLAFRENGKFRVLSTVQNLPNNSTYATLQVKEKLYVGTLGGLAEIENNRVVRTFKDSNSNLTTNWVTALCAANERIFIGTYGGGIFEILPSGEIRSFAVEAGKFVVNPNALYADGERLYAGTLTGAKVLDLRTGEWRAVREILPSETVMSIAGNAKSVYFATTNGIARIEKSYFTTEESR
ncbi:MAG: hypothetical protein LH472_08620, partial [Pyrinomonadaceae bacterium]|nr:hypothetical protein [Pyrinomonadaceae bacterium]